MQVKLYRQIATDTAGSPELALRFFGLPSSDGIVIIMILVTLIALCVLIGGVAASSYYLWLQRKLELKWSLCTIEPPRVKSWKLDKVYACFLSHFKMGDALDLS